jgi:hypothetical protein
MVDNVKANLMWENNSQTPISANNLSETIDYKADQPFISFTNTNEDYKKIADVVISYESWPDPTIYDETFLNKRFYNTVDGKCKQLIAKKLVNSDEVYDFTDIPSFFKKLLSIKQNILISTGYTNFFTKKYVFACYNTGLTPQLLTIDDILTQQAVPDFEPDKRYCIYLYVRYSYIDSARFKIISESEENSSFWKQTGVVAQSPTNNDIIAYRKVGGFETDSNGYIISESIWDLYTRRDVVVASKIKIIKDEKIKSLSAQDFTVTDVQKLFDTSKVSELSVEDAIFNTKSQINTLSKRFYSNRRIGAQLQFSHLYINTQGRLDRLDPSNLTIRLTPGVIDLPGIQVDIPDYVYLADPRIGIKINSGTQLQYTPRLIQNDDGTGSAIYEGVWRVYIDFMGTITIRHETAEDGVARYSKQYFGWYDTTGKRCIGKFRVKSSNTGMYIEKFSVVNTFDEPAPIDSIHTLYSTLVPDGLVLCDGFWHDVTGVDLNIYRFDEIPPIAEWGDSWYEETPDYVGKFIRGADPTFAEINGGPFIWINNVGNTDDYQLSGGDINHSHPMTHDHGTGSLNIVTSGAHPGGHNLQYNGTADKTSSVTTVPDGAGTKVGNYDHQHNITLMGGDHIHSTSSFSGRTEVVSIETETASSFPPFRDALICIRKI